MSGVIASMRTTADPTGAGAVVSPQVPAWETWEVARVVTSSTPLTAATIWNETDTYPAGTVVAASDRIWRALQAVPAATKPGAAPAFWQLVAGPDDNPRVTVRIGGTLAGAGVDGGTILGYAESAGRDDFTTPATLYPGQWLTVAWQVQLPGTVAAAEVFGTRRPLR